MKITKTNEEAWAKKKAKTIAHFGCDVCPCCGETRSWNYRSGEDAYGICAWGLHRNYTTGFFKMKFWQIDLYSCKTCGAEWESDPYEV